MKKLYFIIVFTFFSVFAFGQQEKFNGIGIFKIGTEISALMDFAQKQGLKIKTTDDESKLNLLELSPTSSLSGKSEIIKLVENPKKPTSEVRCPEVQEYHIGKYEVSGIVIYNIRVKYFHDKLYYFCCTPSTALLEAMKDKYGRFEPVVKNRPSKCSEALNDITYTTSWSNGDITAQSSLSVDYNSDCSKSFFEFFYYTLQNSGAKECEEQAKEQRAKINTGSLKDF